MPRATLRDFLRHQRSGVFDLAGLLQYWDAIKGSFVESGEIMNSVSSGNSADRDRDVDRKTVTCMLKKHIHRGSEEFPVVAHVHEGEGAYSIDAHLPRTDRRLFFVRLPPREVISLFMMDRHRRRAASRYDLLSGIGNNMSDVRDESRE